MKGQIFLAGAALLIVLLAIIGMTFGPAATMPATSSLGAQLDNLAREYRYAAGFSSGADRVYELTNYLRSEVRGFQAAYALAIVNDNGSYSLTVGNFLRNVADVTITAGSSMPSSASASIADGSRTAWDFTSAGNVQITVTYTVQNKQHNQSLNFTADKNQTVISFDVGILSGSDAVRRGGNWNVTR